ncbi:MAG TPA: pantoate--beta-alanine ligase [Candidatus Deferrimicrobium sp.]|nr:pantoate--beta-alanine ligase [Candidatus Deferrimicrobium sp.]
MSVIRTIAEVRNKVKKNRALGQSIALVPTMGYLHQGHLQLIKSAKRDGHYTVVSIFVNPLQFGPKEDFASYPRDLERDVKLAVDAGADVIFAPEVQEMYPIPCLTGVEVQQLGNWLCGKSRPGHFNGVCTVVSKLFNIVQPDWAYFGEKDAQQLAIIRKMVFDLNYPVEVVGVPIVREEDGLARSSRNIFLNQSEREQAPVLWRALQIAQGMYFQGERESAEIKNAMLTEFGKSSLAKVDYIEIVDTINLQPITQLGSKALVAVAVRFGQTRLIDNLTLVEEKCTGQ